MHNAKTRSRRPEVHPCGTLRTCGPEDDKVRRKNRPAKPLITEGFPCYASSCEASPPDEDHTGYDDEDHVADDAQEVPTDELEPLSADGAD